FFAIAAKMMRRILVDHARRRARLRRGGAQKPLPLEVVTSAGADPTNLLDLNVALDRLATFDPFKASIVELHFFAGLSVAETADALDSSAATISRHWLTAKAWIYKELGRSSHGS
ncbi:MAG: ECF-type sigma factor, partial [Acidobacteriota bacterium]